MILDYRLNSRIIADLYFKVETPLHVGHRQEGLLKKVILIQVGSNYLPIIPCETIKGAFRYIASKIAKSMKFNEVTEIAVKLHNKDTHIPTDKENEGGDRIIGEYKEKAEKWLKDVVGFTDKQIRELSDFDIVNIYLASNCPICRLFGAPSVAGKINFFDAIPEGPWEIVTYTSTSISRKTRTVEGGRLFSYQFVCPTSDLIYKVRMIVDNLDFEDLDGLLLLRTIEYIDKFGLQLGGLKSKGHGVLRLDKVKSNMKILKFNVDPKGLEDIKRNIETLLLKNVESVSFEELLGG